MIDNPPPLPPTFVVVAEKPVIAEPDIASWLTDRLHRKKKDGKTLLPAENLFGKILEKILILNFWRFL